MFFNTGKLNEGKGNKEFSNSKNNELSEGKDPKINHETASVNWRKKEVSAHSNHSWEKLRF